MRARFGGHRRPGAEHEPGRHRHGEREEQHAAVDLDLARARREPADELDEQAQRGVREGEAEHAAGRRHDEALGGELPEQPDPAGAERRAQPELADAAHRERQREVRDVGAGQDQDQQRGRAEGEQQRPAVGGELLLERRRPSRQAA